VLVVHVRESDAKPVQCSDGFFWRQRAVTQKLSRDDALSYLRRFPEQGRLAVAINLVFPYRVGPDGGGGDALSRAVACGEHLLRKRTESPEGPRAWKTDGDRLLTGFSHGAAGIAYALLRLFEATRDRRFKQTAEEAIQYERAMFVPERGNWPDLSETEDNREPGFRVATFSFEQYARQFVVPGRDVNCQIASGPAAGSHGRAQFGGTQ
jgi:hypothetical protein